jgi:hypothetical protein
MTKRLVGRVADTPSVEGEAVRRSVGVLIGVCECVCECMCMCMCVYRMQI